MATHSKTAVKKAGGSIGGAKTKAGLAKALRAAHSPAARAKATESVKRLSLLRGDLARQYNLSPKAFSQSNLLETAQHLGLKLSAIPEDLFHPFPVSVRKSLLAQRANGGNGHDLSGGVGIPLDAIPARGNGTKKQYNLTPKKVGHPNAEIITKIVDLLGRPDTSPEVADRLLTALDKLLL